MTSHTPNNLPSAACFALDSFTILVSSLHYTVLGKHIFCQVKRPFMAQVIADWAARASAAVGEAAEAAEEACAAAREAASVLLLTKQAELQAAGLLKGGNAAALLKACFHAFCTVLQTSASCSLMPAHSRRIDEIRHVCIATQARAAERCAEHFKAACAAAAEAKAAANAAERAAKAANEAAQEAHKLAAAAQASPQALTQATAAAERAEKSSVQHGLVCLMYVPLDKADEVL